MYMYTIYLALNMFWVMKIFILMLITIRYVGLENRTVCYELIWTCRERGYCHCSNIPCFLTGEKTTQFR